MTPDNAAHQSKPPSKISKGLLHLVVIAAIPLLSVLLTYYLTKEHDLELKITQDKITRYENLITHINRGFLSSDSSDNEKAQNKRMYYEQTYVVWLYAPDDVIRALNRFALDFAAWDANKTPKLEDEVKRTMAALVLAIRKDLHKGTCLKETDFITTIVH